MRQFKPLIFIVIAATLLAAYSCSQPDTQDSYIKSTQARAGIYDFEVDMTDSLATYDFWFYSRSASATLRNIELRILWTSPSGSTFRETVYMRKVEYAGTKELYRSNTLPSELGIWKLNVRPVIEDKNFLGLGLIAKRNNHGTR